MENNTGLTITIPISEYRELLEIQIRSQNSFMAIEGLHQRLTNIEILIDDTKNK